MSSNVFFIYGFSAFLLSLIFTRIMIWVNVMDVPGERSSHRRTTPRSGGFGIIAALVFMVIGAYAYGTFEGLPSKPILVILLSSLFIGLVGFLDDLKNLTWLSKLGVQGILAVTVVLSGVTMKTIDLPYLGAVPLGFWGNILAVFWIVGFTNAFNFMDGINGLTGLVSLVISIGLLCIIQRGDALVVFTLGLLPFALTGFLVFNFPRGLVFLGDVGSQFLGFLFACFALLIPVKEQGVTIWALPLLFLIYLFDTGFTIGRRWLKKENLFQAHKDHLYQLLVQAGWSHGLVALLYTFFFSLQVFMAFWMIRLKPSLHVSLFLALFGLYIGFAVVVMRYARNRGLKV